MFIKRLSLQTQNEPKSFGDVELILNHNFRSSFYSLSSNQYQFNKFLGKLINIT